MAATEGGKTKERKDIETIVKDLKENHAREFGCVLFDGLLVATHKRAFEDLSLETVLTHGVTSLHGSKGIADLSLMTPGSLLPLFPSAINATVVDGETNLEMRPSARYMADAIILRGAQHVDKTAQGIFENVHEYDRVIASMAAKCAQREEYAKGNSAHSAGCGILDSAGGDEQQLERLLAATLPAGENPDDYVLYVVFSRKAALEYCLSNLKCLPKIDAEVVENRVVTEPIRLSETTYPVDTDNPFWSDEKAPTYARLLATADNAVLLRPGELKKPLKLLQDGDAVTKAFYTDMHALSEQKWTDLAAFPFLVSETIAQLGTELPIPLLMEGEGTAALINRLKAVGATFISNGGKVNRKITSFVEDADQLALYGMSVSKTHGILPAEVQAFRNAPPVKTRWPRSRHERIRGNARISGEAVTEAMRDSRAELLTLFSPFDHVFHADRFLTAKQIAGDNEAKDSGGLKNVKVRPMSSIEATEKTPFTYQVFAGCGWSPFVFKRHVLINCLFLSAAASDLSSGICHPELYEMRKGDPLPTSPPGFDENRECHVCGSVPFFNGVERCLCYIMLKGMNSLLGEKEPKELSLVLLYKDLMVSARKKPGSYAKDKTSYKAVHNLLLSEQFSGCGSTGTITLFHTGRQAGFLTSPEQPMDEQPAPATMAAATAEQKETTEQKNFAKKLKKSKRLERVIDEVKSKMGRYLTLGDTESETPLDADRFPLWAFQKIASLGEDQRDCRAFAHGTPDDERKTIRESMLAQPGVEIFPLMQGDRPPRMTAAAEEKDGGGVQDLWAVPEGKKEEEEDEAPPAKKAKTTKGTRAKYTDMVRAALYKTIAEEEDREGGPKSFSGKFKTAFDGEKSIKAVLWRLMGVAKDVVEGGKKDGGLLPLVVKHYLNRVADAMKNLVHTTADALNMTACELDSEFSLIAYTSKRVKREAFCFIDCTAQGRIGNRSNMMTVYQLTRHLAEAKFTTTEALQIEDSSAVTLLSDRYGPYFKPLVGKVPLHTLTLAPGNRLRMGSTASQKIPVAYNMYTPIRTKVEIPLLEFPNKQKTTTSVETEEDGECFVPQPLISDSGRSLGEVRPLTELYDCLRDRRLKLAQVGTVALVDPSAKEQTARYITDYLARRKNSQGQKCHSWPVDGLINMMLTATGRVYEYLGAALETIGQLLPDDLRKEKEVATIGLLADSLKQDFLATSLGRDGNRVIDLVGEVCAENPELGGALYVFLLMCEIYSPGQCIRGCVDTAERDNHLLLAIAFGCLRLYFGNDDCEKTLRSESAQQSRILPMINVSLTDAGPHTATYSVKKTGETAWITPLTIGSYKEQVGENLVTGGKGGTNFRKESGLLAKLANKGPHDKALMLTAPLEKVYTIDPASKRTIADLARNMSIRELFLTIQGNSAAIGELIGFYEAEGVPLKDDTVSDDECLARCVRIHGIEGGDARQIYADYMWPCVLRFVPERQRVGAAAKVQKMLDDDEDYRWSDDESD